MGKTTLMTKNQNIQKFPEDILYPLKERYGCLLTDLGDSTKYHALLLVRSIKLVALVPNCHDL